MIVFTDLGRMVSIFFLCFLLIGYVHGSALMFTIALFCLAIIFVSTFLAWYALHGVKCRRKLPGSMTFSGDPFETTIELADESPRWRLLEIFDKHTNMITDQVTHRRMTVLLEGGTFDTASVNGTRYPMRHIKKDHRLANIPDTIRFPRRGHYRLGPLTLYSYDPFGLVYVQRALHEHDDVIVYPHPLPLPELIISGLNGRQTVDIGRAGHVGETADFHGIRPYVQGDDLRRVHWKSTAHSGKLAVKEFEYHSSGAMHLILDLQHGVHTGINDHATLETAITLSTSLLNYVLEAGNRAGFLSTGEHLVSFAPESGQRQLHRILEALALANDNGKVSLAQALRSEDIAHSGHYATVVITPTVDKAIIGPL
ncbi:MAG TPA: DUF58 domain-containing protein, partial [Armatimonadota bacterium]|nr:DUF58 domain-containing protein [Armatimonadota bacterium]